MYFEDYDAHEAAERWTDDALEARGFDKWECLLYRDDLWDYLVDHASEWHPFGETEHTRRVLALIDDYITNHPVITDDEWPGFIHVTISSDY